MFDPSEKKKKKKKKHKDEDLEEVKEKGGDEEPSKFIKSNVFR